MGQGGVRCLVAVRIFPRNSYFFLLSEPGRVCDFSAARLGHRPPPVTPQLTPSSFPFWEWERHAGALLFGRTKKAWWQGLQGLWACADVLAQIAQTLEILGTSKSKPIV